MSKYDENSTKEDVLETYKQSVRVHFQREAEHPERKDEDRPNPPPPMPKEVVAKYQINNDDMMEVRKLALDELSENEGQSESNKLIYGRWYGNLYAPQAPTLDFAEVTPVDFDKFPVPPLVPQPPAEPYPVAAPPKEPPAPDMNQVREGLALEEAAMAPPPNTPPPPLSGPLPALDFDKFPVPTMVESEQRPKRGLFSQIKDWLKARLSGSAASNSQNETFEVSLTLPVAAPGIAKSKAGSLRDVVESQNPNTAKGSVQGIMSAQKRQELKETKARVAKS